MIVLLLSGSVDAVVKTVCGAFENRIFLSVRKLFISRFYFDRSPRGVKSPLLEAWGPSPYRSGFVIRERAKTWKDKEKCSGRLFCFDGEGKGGRKRKERKRGKEKEKGERERGYKYRCFDGYSVSRVQLLVEGKLAARGIWTQVRDDLLPTHRTLEYVRVFWFALNDDQWRGFTIFRVVRLILRSSGATILSFAVNIVETDAIMCCDVKWDSLDGRRRLCATTKNFYVNSSMRSFPGYRMWVNTSFQKPRFCVTMCRICTYVYLFFSFLSFFLLLKSSWRLIGLWKSFLFIHLFHFPFFLRTSIVRFR